MENVNDTLCQALIFYICSLDSWIVNKNLKVAFGNKEQQKNENRRLGFI